MTDASKTARMRGISVDMAEKSRPSLRSSLSDGSSANWLAGLGVLRQLLKAWSG